MAKFKVYIIILMVTLVAACSSNKKIQSDDDFATDPAAAEASSAGDDLSLDDDPSTAASESGTDEFAEFEDDQPTSATAGNTESKAPPADDMDLENELNSLSANEQPTTNQAPVQQAQNSQPPASEPAVNEQVVSEPVVAEAPPAEQPAPIEDEPARLSQISAIDYKSNDNGGTVMITADQPLQFTTRTNSTTNQLIVEVQNSIVPKRLKRSLNTKDMASSIGSVDIYQKANSKVARFVIQLRPGTPEPLVQPEGNSLLIVGGGNPNFKSASNDDAEAAEAGNSEVNPDLTSEGIMSTQSLEDFLMSNNRFYGKKISIETNNLDIKDAIKFIAEESGVNMIMDEGLEGKVSLKLRQVPWDQALVLLLKSKKLGYRRQGNVLRIAKIDDIKKEEEDGIRLKEAKQNVEQLVVKRFFIGYADIKELETKIKEFIAPVANVSPAAGSTASAQVSRSRVISDSRTNSIIVTDTQSNIDKIEKLIAALDTQPQQVLIEGKVVEAREGYAKEVGVNWANNSAAATTVNRGSLRVSPSLGANNAVFGAGVTWGQMDFLGDLTAQLSLGEREDKARVLSSPRISVLSNQVASISQTTGVLIPKVSTTTNGQTTITNEVVPVGVMLKVTPQVSNEGTVTLTLDIERSFMAQPDSTVPDKRNAATKVIVKSGQTAVIGGIFETQTTSAVSGVPGFKDIPILGTLFKGTSTNKTKNELIIFITPRVLQPVAGEKRSNVIQ